MPEEYDNDLLREGLLHFKSKDFAMARRYFERALAVADDLQTQAQANFYLSQLTDDPRQKRQFLEETLAIDMGNAAARRSLAILDGKLTSEEIVDPEALPAPVSGTQTAQAGRFTCPQCGGRMLYTPDGASLVCENCGHTQSLDSATPGAEQDFFVAMANGKGFRKTISVKTFQCQGCGANFLLAPSELSATCAYCGSLHVIALDTARELCAPDAVIPMAVDQERAILQLAEWIGKKRLKPQPRVGAPRGLYLPVWAFDLIGSLPWSGRVIRDKREVPVSGESPAVFNDVCIPASPQLAGLIPELLPGYSLAAAPAYDPRFLAGWPAEVYATAMSDAALQARQVSVEKIRREIHIGQGNVIDLHFSASAVSITSYRLILLPVWVASYAFKAQTFRVVVNGQTGTVAGETPGHARKIK
jgi:DNA-directed RNA polymerase subunit RPC12/RpoP